MMARTHITFTVSKRSWFKPVMSVATFLGMLGVPSSLLGTIIVRTCFKVEVE